jgi:1-acyl-sn-glycerol-3-phosphate acyltransferase
VGGAALAAGTGYPVVPVAHDAGYYWPRRGFRKRAGVVRVVIGPLIDSHGKTAEQINREAEAWMTRTMHELDRAHQHDR